MTSRPARQSGEPAARPAYPEATEDALGPQARRKALLRFLALALALGLFGALVVVLSLLGGRGI